MTTVAAVEVEYLHRYFRFLGCSDCLGAKQHEYATCPCDCHKRPDRRVQIVLSCGCRRDVGLAIDAPLPVVGESNRCWSGCA